MAAPMIKSFHSIHTQSGMNLEYVVYMPDGLSGKLPLVLSLHGAGERGRNIDLVDIHGFPKQAKAGTDFPFILVAPQCPLDRYWSDSELVDGLIAIQKSCFQKFNVDTERFYVTGLSMGGYGTYALASKIPHKIAAALPVCGVADLKTIHKMKDIPTWIFHGDQDQVILVKNSLDAFGILDQINPNVHLTIYEGIGHDSWTETYQNPDVLDWMLSQQNHR
jgi:predicted peptidase|tara:strand:+ start:771 stop:1430 length:660 start_codon:yes stop_codon:yes gene_type:complete